jgi:hypothetical protein
MGGYPRPYCAKIYIFSHKYKPLLTELRPIIVNDSQGSSAPVQATRRINGLQAVFLKAFSEPDSTNARSTPFYDSFTGCSTLPRLYSAIRRELLRQE